jgi:cytochrome c-type biogenesis protein CcmH/NrfG
MVLLAVPLYSARAVQNLTLGKLLNAYGTADLMPVDVKARPVQDWTLFERATAATPHSGLINPPRGFNIEYWVAEFAPSSQWRTIWLQYAKGSANPYDDWFSHGLWVAPGGKTETGNTRYFFPVVEQTRVSQGGWALFAGIGVPKAQAGDFRGLYKVRNTKDFPLFLNLSCPAERAALVPRQTLYGDTTGKMDADTAQGWLGRLPLYRIPPPNTALPENDREEIVKACRDGLATDPNNGLLRLGLATCLESQADKETAIKSYREALQADPGFFVTYHYIDDFLKRRGEVADRIALWRETAQANPDNYLPQFHLALAFEENHDTDGALEAYRKVLNLNPSDSATLGDLGRLLAAKNDLDGAVNACKRALQIEPLDLQTTYTLQAIQERRGAS